MQVSSRWNTLPDLFYEFPIHFGGGVFQTKMIQVLYSTQAPLPMVAQGGLATASFLFQNLIDVEKPNGQIVPPNQYFCSVANSGERKTTVDNEFFSPISKLEKELDQKYAEEVNEFELSLTIWKTMKKRLLKDVVKDGSEEIIETLYEHEKQKPKHPPRVGIRTLSDVTPAAAIDLFDRESIKSMILRSNEGEEVLLGSAAQKLSLWNALWSGDSVRVDRKTGTSCLVNPRATIYIQAQPSIMQRFITKSGGNARGIGFFARTHITYPVTTQGSRSVKELIQEPNRQYDALVKDLFNQNIAAGKNSDFERIVVRFTSEAKGRWFVVANEIERQIQVGGRFEGFGDHASKLADNIARMAAILNCAEFGMENEVSLSTLNDAILICFWFSNEFIRLFRSPSEEQRDYFSLQCWLNQKRTEGFRYLRKNHVRKYCPNALRDTGKLNILLGIMQNNGEIRTAVVAKKVIIDLYPGFPENQALLLSEANM